MAHAALDPAFRRLIDEHAPVRQAGSGFMFTEGPIWHPVDRYLLFSDMPGDVRRRLDASGVREVMRPSMKGNGMTYDADLNLLVCEHATSSVARVRPEGTREVMCSHFEGRELNSPNDICVHSDGSVWFTDPWYGRMPVFGVERPRELGWQGFFRMAPGHRPGEEPQLVVDRYTFTQPNGLCFSPDERLLYLVESRAQPRNIKVFDVVGDGDRLANPRDFADLHGGTPDGFRCDIHGNLWCGWGTGAERNGVAVFAPDGTMIGRIALPERAANLCFGGLKRNRLFIAASHSLYSVYVNTQGAVGG
jgi:gluconolactonase